ncbi:MAG: glycosyltransferase [Bacteroidales bacterium]|nr:glycosyltransferase [Bacteroidales bacterium]
MNLLDQLDILSKTIGIVFVVAGFIQLLYYFIIYIRPVCRKEKPDDRSEFPPVSVIVCARNEKENLEAGLVLLLTQDYPQYEVIVVNDCSEDSTEELLTVLKSRYAHLRSTIIKQDASFRNSKKFASFIGIKAAQYEWMLFTDAGCRVAGNQWIRSMSRYFKPGKSIILGYGGYLAGKGLLNKWIQYTACFDTLRCFGFALCRMPYMGIGRNLAYRKSLFYQHNGSARHVHVLSGENDLFVSQAATSRNVAVNSEPAAHTYSAPKTEFRDWMRRQCEHYAILEYAKWHHLLLLWTEPFSRILLWTSFVSLCILHPDGIPYFFCIFLFRMSIFLLIFRWAMKRFKVKGILWISVFFDLVMPFIYAHAYILNKMLLNQQKWK